MRGERGYTGWSKATATSAPSASWISIACSGVKRWVDPSRWLRNVAAVLVDLAQVAQRDDLEAARVGQDRPVPVHEPVQPAEARDPLVARAQVQVIGVGEDDRSRRRARSSGESALTVAFVPTGMNCGVSTTPCGKVSRPVPARVDPSAGGGGVDLERRGRRETNGGRHAPPLPPGSSQSGTISGSARGGGGIS